MKRDSSTVGRSALSFLGWLLIHSVGVGSPTGTYLRHGNRAKKEVLITFDDGPHPKSATQILDTLHREHVPAVFFVVGIRMIQSPAIVRRMIAEGHEVGNHTETHLRLDGITPAQVKWQIQTCERKFEHITGRHMTLVRPPGMRMNWSIEKECEHLGYTVVGWTVAAQDFIPAGQVPSISKKLERKMAHTTPHEIAQRVLRKISNGSIVLLHDAPLTAKALPEIIRGVKAKGYKFVDAKQFMADSRQGR